MRHKKFNAYILEIHWSTHARSDATRLTWRGISADTRHNAMLSILPEIQSYLLDCPVHQEGSLEPHISLYVGEQGKPSLFASRLNPYTLDSHGNFIGGG